MTGNHPKEWEWPEPSNGDTVESFGLDKVSRRAVLRRGMGLGAAAFFATGLSACADDDAAGDQEPTAEDDTPTAPQQGGVLRLGIGGTPTGHDLDPMGGMQGGEINVAGREMVFERLTEAGPDGEILPRLGTDFSSSSDSTVWMIKLREGVTWHDGSPFTADDVVYSFRYMLNTDTASAQAIMQEMFENNESIQRIDESTVELTLAQPLGLLPQVLSALRVWMVKDGAEAPFNPPIGTGPFKFEGWRQGESVSYSRNPEYWIADEPHIDGLELILIADPAARVNALQSDQIDALSQLEPSLVPIIEGDSSLVGVQYRGGAFTPLAMAVDMPPFDDNRVREAFRLMVDREQLIENALAGVGTLGNDIQNAIDPDRATPEEIPQREYDPDRAQALLREAGHENLTVTLTVSPTIGVSSLETATLFAEQAAAAGVTVELDVVTSDVYRSNRYLQVPFSVNFWSARPLDEYIADSLVPGGANNTTHWDDPDFERIWHEYRGTSDPALRRDLAVELQRILWEQGGFIIWGFQDLVDAHSGRLQGIRQGVRRNYKLYDFRGAYFT